MYSWGTSLVVWWLRLHASIAGDMGLIPDWGTKIPCAVWHGQKMYNWHATLYWIQVCSIIFNICIYSEMVTTVSLVNIFYHTWKVKVLVTQLCPVLCNPMDCSVPGSSGPWNFPSKNTGVGCHSFSSGPHFVRTVNHDLFGVLSDLTWHGLVSSS